MAISSKFAFFKRKEAFEPLIPTIPKGLNPIIFIEDTREMWTCGTYFSVGFPSIEVVEESGSVKIKIGNSYFLMSTVGDGLSIRKGDGNRVIINSNALTKIDTNKPLQWDTSEKKLLHMVSGCVPGSYGQSANLSNASVFTVPSIAIDAYGHITLAENRNVEIRDYVEQLTPSTSNIARSILLSYNATSSVMDTAQVRKANGLTFNDATGKLTISGGIEAGNSVVVTHGDLSVPDGYIIGTLKGDVTGEAIPKIHLSTKPEYGGASKGLYGHVVLQDDFKNEQPPPSNSNQDINNIGVTAKAASPLMVWNATENVKEYVNTHGIKVYAQDKTEQTVNLSSGFTFSKDFIANNNNIEISWIEI